MWTEITRTQYLRKGLRYASDVTEAEWQMIEPRLPAPRRLGRPRKTALLAVVNALFYIARTGCQWRMLPGDFRTIRRFSVIFYVARRRHVAADQFRTAAAGARGGRPGAEPIGGGSSTANRSKPPRAAGRAVTTPARRLKDANAMSSPIRSVCWSARQSTPPTYRTATARCW